MKPSLNLKSVFFFSYIHITLQNTPFQYKCHYFRFFISLRNIFILKKLRIFLLHLITKIVFTIGNNITIIDHKLTEILLLANISQRAIVLAAYTIVSITISKINKNDIINYFLKLVENILYQHLSIKRLIVSSLSS